MINLNRIRSVKTLEEMKQDLTDFLSNPEILNVYVEELDWDSEDYESDKEAVQYLLEQLEHRIVSLKRANLPNDGQAS